jgi:hypothetical protein
MDAVLHRIEALPGAGRWAVTFRGPDGAEVGTVVQVDSDGTPTLAPASLPPEWRDGPAHAALLAAVAAVAAARAGAAEGAADELRDVPGGWDVSLGNVVLDGAGRPACTAHGPLTGQAGRWTCAECGATALFAARS